MPVPVALVALRAIEKLPITDGMPTICPVAVFTVTPAGKPVALKLAGKFVALIW